MFHYLAFTSLLCVLYQAPFPFSTPAYFVQIMHEQGCCWNDQIHPKQIGTNCLISPWQSFSLLTNPIAFHSVLGKRVCCVWYKHGANKSTPLSILFLCYTHSGILSWLVLTYFYVNLSIPKLHQHWQ